jgi:tocopherol cyclase
MSKSAYKLKGRLAKKGYDWWWHSFTGKDAVTGELKPFFIEYYAINPGLWTGDIIWGQQKENQKTGKKPCYAMLKAGSWGDEKAQLHKFFNYSDVKISGKGLNCVLGGNTLTEGSLQGEVIVSEEESRLYPERMTDAGSMKWDMTVNKKLSYDVGYGSSDLFSTLCLFSMFWHVQGLRCEYSGWVEFNGKKYRVEPQSSYGYQDKNWGSDYTNPWIWLNCNNFISKTSGKAVEASLDVGGGCPVVFGIPLQRKILTAFYYKGQLTEFNFSKFWKFSKQKFNVVEDDSSLHWEIISENSKYLLEIRFSCEKAKMLLVNYENPAGEKNHNKLWNGGHAAGTVKFYQKGKERTLIDELFGSLGGCEYGEY